jgi:hypothetical protein
VSDEDLDEQMSNGMRGFAALGTWLAEDGWHPDLLDDKLAYRVGFSGSNGDYRCFATIHEQYELMVFYAVAANRIPEERRGEAALFMARANYGLRIGNFELDVNDGEIRYKSSLDFEGAELTPSLIRNAIYPAVRTLDRYMPGILAVAFGGKSAEEAIGAIENPEH